MCQRVLTFSMYAYTARCADRGPHIAAGARLTATYEYTRPDAERAHASLEWHVAMKAVDAYLLGHHDLDELLVVDLAVTVNVRLADHLVDLLVGQLLAEVGHDVAELRRRDEAVAVLVEDAEGLLELLLGVGVLHLARHERAELGEVDRAVAVGIDLVDHVLELRLGRVQAERAHHGAKLLGSDRAVTSLSKREKASLNAAVCSSHVLCVDTTP